MTKIGLEIHGYLITNEKLFCTCKAEHGSKSAKPNTNICPICTGQPGCKPMLPNNKAVDAGIKIGLVLGCKITKDIIWSRKHYSWPDLPKGFQTTVSGTYSGFSATNGEFLGIRIKEIHLEEDPAAWNPKTGEVDYNRSGSPLIEIVTEPDFKSSEQVINWLKQLIVTLGYIKVIDKNSGIKADVNVSIPNGKRVEVKNVNSLRNIQAVIEHEIKRQSKEIPKEQETRRFDEFTSTTKRMRSKEDAEDYRFITEPDLPAIKITSERINKIKKSLPETPAEKLEKLIKKYKIEKKYAEILIKKLEIVEFFEKIIKNSEPKLATRWTTEELLSVLNYNKKELEEVDIKSEHFVELLKLIKTKKITELKAKDILRSWISGSHSPKNNLENLTSINDSKEIQKIAQKIISENSKAVEDYKSGQQNALNFLIGQVMKLSDKRADFKTAKDILIKELS